MESPENTLLIGVLVTIGIAWIGWISLTVIQNTIKINALAKTYDKIDALQVSIDRINTKLNLFLRNELDELKEIAKNYDTPRKDHCR